MNEQGQRYVSFLLRLWRVEDRGKPAWRASLEGPGDGDHLGFTSIDDLCAFLRWEASLPPSSPPTQPTEQNDPTTGKGEPK